MFGIMQLKQKTPEHLAFLAFCFCEDSQSGQLFILLLGHLLQILVWHHRSHFQFNQDISLQFACVAETWPVSWALAWWISLWPESWALWEQAEVHDNPWCPTDPTQTRIKYFGSKRPNKTTIQCVAHFSVLNVATYLLPTNLHRSIKQIVNFTSK